MIYKVVTDVNIELLCCNKRTIQQEDSNFQCLICEKIFKITLEDFGKVKEN